MLDAILSALVGAAVDAAVNAAKDGGCSSIACPRCEGSGYVDWKQIEKLEMWGHWTPGSCRYCAGSGKCSVQRLREKNVRSKNP